MKASPFDYVRAENLDHALALLHAHGGDAKLLAGGQSLVPMMAMRLARPALLVDIHRLTQLQAIQIKPSVVTIGAGVRQRTLEDACAAPASSLDAAQPLLRKALRWVGHAQTRNRGTLGGSVVHADPSAELPLMALIVGGVMQLQSNSDQSTGGTRTVDAADFFLGPMFTETSETECLTAIDLPVWQVPAGERIAAVFDETAIRHGDFALASAACQIQFAADGLVTRASFGLGGVGGTPLAFPELAAQLVGQRMTPQLADDIANAAAEQSEPGGDMHGSAQYRRHLAAVLLSRSLLQAQRDGFPLSRE